MLISITGYWIKMIPSFSQISRYSFIYMCMYELRPFIDVKHGGGMLLGLYEILTYINTNGS